MTTLGRLVQLRDFVDPGPWKVERSPVDGSVMLWDSKDEPLALVYAGSDVALYIAACAPDTLLGART